MQHTFCLKKEASVPLLTPKPISFTVPCLLLVPFSKQCHPPYRRETWAGDHLGIISQPIAEVGWEFRGRTRIMTYKWCTKSHLSSLQPKRLSLPETIVMWILQAIIGRLPGTLLLVQLFHTQLPPSRKDKAYVYSHSLLPFSCFPNSGCAST